MQFCHSIADRCYKRTAHGNIPASSMVPESDGATLSDARFHDAGLHCVSGLRDAVRASTSLLITSKTWTAGRSGKERIALVKQIQIIFL